MVDVVGGDSGIDKGDVVDGVGGFFEDGFVV